MLLTAFLRTDLNREGLRKVEKFIMFAAIGRSISLIICDILHWAVRSERKLPALFGTRVQSAIRVRFHA